MTAPHVRGREQLVEQLVAGRKARRYVFLGQVEPDEYAVEVAVPDNGLVRRQHPVAGMSAYLDGHAAGRELAEAITELPANVRAPKPIRTLLNEPSVLDQRRSRVAHAMVRHGWTYADVAAKLHAQRSTVRDLLRYGYAPVRITASSRRLDEIEALLPELARGYGGKPAPVADPPERVAPLAEAGLEPPELVRSRALALAVEGGLLSGWSPLDVTEMRSARVVHVVDVTGADRPVRAATLVAWVQGLADGALLVASGWPPAAREQLAVLAHALA